MRIMSDVRKGAQWAEWRMPCVGLSARYSSPGAGGLFAVEPLFVPPNADGNAGFHLQFLQNVLHVLLHGARTASKNFSNLAVALASGDPFYHFELALG